MSGTDEAEVCGRFLWGSDTSNKPLEWQDTTNSQLRRHRLPACHSRAAFGDTPNERATAK